VSIISKYLLRQHLVPFVFALSALTSIMLLNQIARRFPELVGKGLHWTVILEVFVLSVPFLLAMTLPMAVLVSVLYTMSRLTADNELTALRASGVSLWTVTRTLLLGGTVVGVAAFLFSDHILPRSNHRLRALLTDITRTKPTFALEEQVINEVRRNNLFLRAGFVDQSTFKLHDVTIFDLSVHNRKRVTYADSAYMAFGRDQEDLFLTLFDGTMHESDRLNDEVFQVIDFRKDIVRVQDVGSNFNRTLNDDFRGDREMGVCAMDSVVTTAERDRWISRRRAEAVEVNSLRGLVGLMPLPFDTIPPPFDPPLYCQGLTYLRERLEQKPESPQPDTAEVIMAFSGDSAQGVPLGEEEEAGLPPPRPRGRPERLVIPPSAGGDGLRDPQVIDAVGRAATAGAIPRISSARVMHDRAQSARIRMASYQVEIHKKYSIAIASIVFVLVGIPAGIKFPRGGVGLVIGASLVVFGIFYVGLIGGESLANKLVVSPFWAMWAPNVIFAVVGFIALWRLRTQSTSARGGSWLDRFVRRRHP
jgi:lipopolysaccharide export system permease protein